MKNFKFILITFFISFTNLLISQNFQWQGLQKPIDGILYTYCNTDALNNTFVLGSMSGSNIVVGTSTYNPINPDGIIIKYDANGAVVWSSAIAGIGVERCSGISFDANGNFYIVGTTNSSLITVGSSTFSNIGGFTNPDYSTFITKFDSNFNLVYFKIVSHADNMYTFGIKLSLGLNSILISNVIPYSSHIVFGSNTYTAQNDNSYIASFDLNANLNWINFYASPGYIGISDVIVQKNDDIYFAGSTSSQSFVIGGYTLSGISFSVYAGFVGKMSPSGNIKWLKTFPNTNVANLKLTSINTNSIYLGIAFTSSALAIASNTYSSQNSDCLLAQMDSLGNYQWSKLISGNQADNIGSLSVNQNNYLYVVGTSSSSVLSTTNYSAANTNTVSNLFFAAFDTQGKDWGLLMSSRPNANAANGLSPYAIAMDANNNAYIVGYNSYSDLVCGTYTITNTSQNSTFMAKIKLLNGVGINEYHSFADDIQLYPNPTNNLLYFGSNQV